MNTQTTTYTEDEIRQGMIAYAVAVKKNPTAYMSSDKKSKQTPEQLGNAGADFLIKLMGEARTAAEDARRSNDERQARIDKLKSDVAAGIVPTDDDL